MAVSGCAFPFHQELQRDHTGKLSFEEALDEVVADGCEMMLRRTKVMQTMAQEKPGLFRAVKEWMKNWVKTVREAFQGVSEVHEEARAVAQMELDRLEKFTEMWDRGLIEATENAQKSPAKEGGETKYSIERTNKNKPVVIVTEDILDGVGKDQWRVKALTALRRFKSGVPVAGKIIRINQHSRNEYLNSHNTRYYEKKDNQKFEDKLRAANNADEIILATTGYVNEAPHHSRKDAIIDMARGKVLMRIGAHDYVADVLIGYTSGDVLLLHDVEALTETDEIRKTGLRSSGRQITDVKPDSNSPAELNLAQRTEKSNTKLQEREELPDDRELLMAAEAKGRNAEALMACQKKVKSLEALERKLQRQQEALESWGHFSWTRLPLMCSGVRVKQRTRWPDWATSSSIYSRSPVKA